MTDRRQAAEDLGIGPKVMCPTLRTGRDIRSTIVLLGMANLYHASVDYSPGEKVWNTTGRKGEGERIVTALLHEVRRLQEARVWPSAAVYPVDAGGRRLNIRN